MKMIEAMNRRVRIAAMRRAVLLGLTLAGVQGIHAQDLPKLDVLPVSIIAGNFVGAGKSRQFGLGGFTADRGWVDAGATPIDMNLRNVTAANRTPDESHFILSASDNGESKAHLMINLIATNRRCLLTTIDPVLNQANLAGRLIQVRSTLLRPRPVLSKDQSFSELCTMDSGKLALYFSTPSFDMLRLTAVSYGTPSSVLRTMASQSVMFYLPFVKF
jgi:hypothetical protein